MRELSGKVACPDSAAARLCGFGCGDEVAGGGSSKVGLGERAGCVEIESSKRKYKRYVGRQKLEVVVRRPGRIDNGPGLERKKLRLPVAWMEEFGGVGRSNTGIPQGA